MELKLKGNEKKLTNLTKKAKISAAILLLAITFIIVSNNLYDGSSIPQCSTNYV
jgi:hypothetical protein